MPNFWKEAPFVRLLIPFLLGILTYYKIEIWSPDLYLVFGICAAAFALVTFISKAKFKYVYRRLIALLIYLQLCLAGYILACQSLTSVSPVLNTFKLQYVLARVSSNPTYKKQSSQCQIHILQAQDTAFRGATMKAKFELQESDFAYGDTLWFLSTIRSIPKPANPLQFDYRQYLKYQNIHYQVSVKRANWKIVGRAKQKSIFHYAFRIQKSVSQIIDMHFTNAKDRSILKALIIGDKEEINAETKIAFASTGTMHLLAVSGLHVGIIYVLLQYVLGFLFRNKFKIVLLLLSLLALWAFALITGFTPSVCRASFMFSLLAIGKHFHQSAYIYNTIAVSAFMLLLFNPLFILQLGFQFSYLAVIGIIAFQKPIHQLVKTRFWLISKMWSLTSVSIAAQITTLPLALLYFGQFPNYFMLSNLLVIPYISVIIYGTLLVCLLSPFPWIASHVAKFVEAYLWFIQWVLNAIKELPHAVSEGIFITPLESIILFAAILFFVLYLYRKKATRLVIVLITLIAFSFSVHVRYIQNQSSRELIFFELQNETLIVYRDAKNAHTFFAKPQSAYWESSIYPYLNSKGIRDVTFASDTTNYSRQISLGKTDIVLLTQKCEMPNGQIDLVYLKKLYGLDWETLKDIAPVFYLDKSIPNYQKNKFRKWMNEQDWSASSRPEIVTGFHSVALH